MSTGRSFEDHPSDDATREPHFRRTRRGTLMGLEAAESSHPWRYAGLCGRMPPTRYGDTIGLILRRNRRRRNTLTFT